MYKRRAAKTIKIGNICIGNNYPISIQSMTNVKTSDVKKAIEQIKRLEEAGCDIVRFSVMDHEDAKAIFTIKSNTSIPLVADIHFNYRLALESIEAGIDKVRINPGNIGDEDRIAAVCKACKAIAIDTVALPRCGVKSFDPYVTAKKIECF